MGLIMGALQGAGEAGVKVGEDMLKGSIASDLKTQEAAIQAERDTRMQGFAKELAVQADELKRAPAVKAAKEIESLNSEKEVDDGVGGSMKQAPTKSDQRANERKVWMSSGDPSLIQAAIASEGHDIQRKGLESSKLEHEATRAQAKELSVMTDNRIKDENKLNREQQVQMHAERMAQMKESFKNQGISVMSTKEGVQIVDAKTGKSTLVTGADGKPLHQLKEDDSFKLISSLSTAAKAAADSQDFEAEKRFNTIIVSVLKGKTNGTATKPSVDPSQFDPRAKKTAAVETKTQSSPTPSVQSYAPIEGSQAAEAVAKREGIMQSQVAKSVESNAAKATAQRQFEADKASMGSKELLEKWDSDSSNLTPIQQAALYKIRNSK